ncbi:hypothetical protein D9757_000068 [Collybiopsis confluens]|uniref:ThrRS/AlaRS common domain-containing protein n=1 Tax=Collybiopsis confluens TaxID=2823264 RepID=A0A8H5I1Y8_9AGAR|nr:hypothetical protein D9757_000068 [Collybiopsis confluens]
MATNSDYFRIVSPTLRVPSNKSISIPVGILACQRDPLLRELETTVIHCMISQAPPAFPNGKQTKNKKVLSPTLPNEPILQVVTHDTCIFPEGGGQPTDTGLIKTADGKLFSVLQAKRHGSHAVHYVQANQSDIDSALLSFTPGSTVVTKLGKDDFDRRYDHMSMHTSQHLLSALLEAKLHLPTLSWSLTSYPSSCYVEVPRVMTAEEIKLIQDEANRLVFEGRAVYTEVEELDENKKAEPATLESGRSVGRGLPTDYTGGIHRVVIIDGVDRNPCCGTHLPSIKNLQLFLLPHTDTMSRSNTSCARLYFLSGPRLITYLTSAHDFLTRAASILSVGNDLVPDRVRQVVEERKKADKRVSELELELAKSISAGLVNESTDDKQLFKRYVHRTNDSSNPLGFLSSIASAFSEQMANFSTPYLLVLTSAPAVQTLSSSSIIMVVGSDDKLVKCAGDALKSQLEVKGGGNGLRWSGKRMGVWKEHKEGGLVDSILKAIQ